MTLAQPSRSPVLLVIDDDLLILKYQDAVLTAAGFSCRVSQSASDGLRDLDQHMPDAVLCDYHMPSATGLDFLRGVRAVPAFENLPVGIVTTDIAIADAIVTQIEAYGGVVRTGVLPREELVELARQLTNCAGRRRSALRGDSR